MSPTPFVLWRRPLAEDVEAAAILTPSLLFLTFCLGNLTRIRLKAKWEEMVEGWDVMNEKGFRVVLLVNVDVSFGSL